jgi:hypothetical protein
MTNVVGVLESVGSDFAESAPFLIIAGFAVFGLWFGVQIAKELFLRVSGR